MGKALRLLLVEDSEDDALLLLRELRRGGYGPEYERVETAEAMREALQRRSWDLVVSDYVLPQFSGLAALAVYKESGLDLPFIMVSGNIGEDIAVEAMKAGAHDYIMKGSYTRLIPAIERELREAEVRHKSKLAEADRIRLITAIESTPDAIVTTDTGGVIRYVNPAFEQITGHARDEVIGQDLRLLSSDEHYRSFYNEAWNTLGKGNACSGHLISRKKDGTPYEEDVTISPVRDAFGEVNGYVLVKRDITKRLRLESIAEAANLMNNIGYIFSGIRHEIGNPINSIKTTLSVLKRGFDKYDKAKILDYLERTIDEFSRIEYLFKSLKNYTVHEDLELQNIDISAFLDKFLMLVKGDFTSEKKIEITSAVDHGVGYAYADPRALHQILLNVFTNAADALHDRENPVIAVAVARTPDTISICVEDNGCGMTPEQQNDLFKPFHTTKPKGTGLGLIIIRKMLSKMGGDIRITSRKDIGTVVSIFLPAVMEETVRDKREGPD